jgi:hypothetical protein
MRLGCQPPGGVPGGAEFERDGGGAGSADLFHLLAGGVEAYLESFDLAEPAAFGGFTDPLVQAGDDLREPHALLGVNAEHRAAEQACSWRQGVP